MRAPLLRLSAALLLLVGLALGAISVLDQAARDRIDRAARDDAEVSTAYLRGYAAAAQRRAVPAPTLLRELLDAPLPPTETRIAVLPGGKREVRGEPALVHDPAVVTDPQRLRVQRMERVDSVVGPAWVVEVPVRSAPTAGQVVGSYVTVHPTGAELADQHHHAVEQRRNAFIVAAALGGIGATAIVLHHLAGRILAVRRRRGPPSTERPGTERSSARRSGAGRPLGAVVVEGFASRLAFGLVTFALPLYAHRLGMSLASIGLLLSTNAGVALLLKPVMGAVIDRVGVRHAYVVAVVLRTAVLVTLVLATGPLHLFLARGLHGVSIALRDPASATVLSALGGKKAVAQRFAWYQTVKSVAGSGGQFASGVLLTLLAGDFRVVFLVAAVLSGVPLGVVLWGLRGPLVARLRLPQPAAGTGRGRFGVAAMPRDLRRALLPYAGLGAMMTGTAYLMSNLLPVLAVDHMGLAPAAASSLYLVKSVVSLTGPVWGWLSDRVSVRLVLGVRALGNGLSSLVWLAFPSFAGLLVGRMLDDVGKAAFAPAWGSVMAKVSDIDPPRRARTLAMMSSAEDAGELAGPVVAGVIWSAFGLPVLLGLRAALAVGTEVYAFWLGRRVQLPAQSDDPGAHSGSDSASQPGGGPEMAAASSAAQPPR